MDDSEVLASCGNENALLALGNVSALEQSLGHLSELNDATINSLYCSNFNPLATDIFHYGEFSLPVLPVFYINPIQPHPSHKLVVLVSLKSESGVP